MSIRKREKSEKSSSSSRSKHTRKVVESGKSLEEELEHAYKVKVFFEWGPIFSKWCLLMALGSILSIGFVPGARFTGCLKLIHFSATFMMSKHVDRQKGTRHEVYAMNLFGRFIMTGGIIQQVMELLHNSSNDTINTSAAMVILTKHFFASLFFRISSTPAFYRWTAISCIVSRTLIKPPFGTSRFEFLAFFVVIGLGEYIGNSIDEMNWKSFVQIEKQNRELEEATRTRAMAMEALMSYQPTPLIEIAQ